MPWRNWQSAAHILLLFDRRGPHRAGTHTKGAQTMFLILMWLMGVPLGLIVILWILGIGR
jgi:hypothetical protein